MPGDLSEIDRLRGHRQPHQHAGALSARIARTSHKQRHPDEIPLGGPMAIRAAAADSPLQQELRFLNVTGSVELDDDARTTIRAQSLRDYHRKRKIQRSSDGAKASNEPISQAAKRPGARVQRFRLGSDGLKPTQTQPQPTYVRNTAQGSPNKHAPSRRDRVGNEASKAIQIRGSHALQGPLQPVLGISGGGLDPFDVLPLPSTPRIRVLVNQLMFRINSNSPTRDYRRFWFEHASQDLACFYIALSQSAADTALTLHKGRTAEAVIYENKALRLINQRLNDPVWRVHNTTIGAVSALASYEISNGSIDAARAHLLGMEKMVRMRGGIDDPSISPGLRRIVLWVDLIAASHDIAVPRISTYLGSSPALASIGPDSNMRRFAECIITKQKFATIKDLTASIDQDIRVLTEAKIAQKFATATLDEEILFGEKAYLVQRRLLELQGTLAAKMPHTWTVETVWALGVSVYMSVILFETSINSVIVDTLVQGMQECMEELMQRDGHVTVARAIKTDGSLFWALVLGAIASEGKPQRAWFVELLRTVCQLLDPRLGKAPAARRALVEDILWGSSLDDAAHRLWAEVDAPIGVGGGVFDVSLV